MVALLSSRYTNLVGGIGGKSGNHRGCCGVCGGIEVISCQAIIQAIAPLIHRCGSIGGNLEAVCRNVANRKRHCRCGSVNGCKGDGGRTVNCKAVRTLFRSVPTTHADCNRTSAGAILCVGNGNLAPRCSIKTTIGDDGVISGQRTVIGHMSTKTGVEGNDRSAVDGHRTAQIVGKAVPQRILELKVSDRNDRFVVDRVVGF